MTSRRSTETPVTGSETAIFSALGVSIWRMNAAAGAIEPPSDVGSAMIWAVSASSATAGWIDQMHAVAN